MRPTLDTREFDRALKLVRQWRGRASAVRRQFLFLVAQSAYSGVLDALPADRKELRESITLRRIRGLPEGEDGYVVGAPVRAKVLSPDRAEREVLYISMRTKIMRRVPEVTKVLEEHSPWTSDLLPCVPDPKTAVVLTRRVSRREVVRVRKMRQRDRPVWRRRLIAAGVTARGQGEGKHKGEVLATPDLAFESLRLEFGLGGEPSKPHWRRTILRLASGGGAAMIARKREFEKAMLDLSFSSWKRWPESTRGGVSLSEAKGYVPFQKRLGIRVGRG